MPREQFANNAFTLTDGVTDDNQTTIDVISGALFPSTGNFRLKIEDEILLCTARATNTLTVVRGIEGTTGASHSDGSPIAHILTDGSVNRWLKDSVVLAGDDSTMPALNTIVDDSGAVITASGFSWTGQGGAAVTDQHGTIVMRVDADSGDNFRIQRRAAPSAPYSYIAAFQAIGNARSTLPNFGLGFRDSSNGKMVACLVLCDSTSGQRLQVSNLTNETSFHSNVANRQNYALIGQALWLKIENDNTDTIFYISADGIEWIEVARAGKTAFTSALDQIFWFGNNVGTGADMLVRLCHWSRAS